MAEPANRSPASSPSLQPALRSEDFPALWASADDASNRAQRRHTRAIQVQLTAAVLVALAAELGTLLDSRLQMVLVGATALFLGSSLLTQILDRRRGYEALWYHGRALAENARSSTWRFMLRLPPFDGPDDQAETELRAVLAQLRHAATAAERHTPSLDHDPVTPAMRRVRAEDWLSRRQRYLDERLDDQVRWYATRSHRNAVRGRWFFWLTVAAQGLALLAALVRSTHALPNFSGTAATLLASLVAWSQSRRFSELATSYAVAGAELRELAEELSQAASEGACDAALLRAEIAIAREHTMWFAKSAVAIRPITAGTSLE